MRLSARVGAAGLLVATVLGACSSSSSKPANASKPTAPVRSVPASFEELAARIITKVPAGFVLQPDNVGDTGRSDLAKASRRDDTPNSSNVLRAEKFVRGYERLWIGPAEAQIIVIIYQFESQAGARQDYARRAKANSRARPGAYKFAAPGLPTGEAFGAVRTNNAVAVVIFTTGVFIVQILCNEPKAKSLVKPLQARVTSIAQDQFGRL